MKPKKSECIARGCHRKPAKTHVLCRKHLEYFRKSNKELRDRRRQAGQCRQCPLPAEGNRVFCATHRILEKCRCGLDHWAHEHSNLGLCAWRPYRKTRCPNPGPYCKEHVDKHLAKLEQNNRKHRKAARKRAIAKKFCLRCYSAPRAAHSKSRCESCLEYARKDQAIRDQALKDAK